MTSLDRVLASGRRRKFGGSLRSMSVGGVLSNYLFVSLIGRFANIVAVLLMAKSMGASDFGTFAFFQSTSAVTLSLGTFSLPTTLGVIISRGDRSRVPLENALLAILFVALALFCSVVAVLVIALSARETMTTQAEWLLFAVFVAVSCVQSLSQSVLFARGHARWSSTCLALASWALCLGVYLFKPGSIIGALTLSNVTLAIGVSFAGLSIFRGGILSDRTRVWSEGLAFARRRGLELVRFSFLALSSGFVFQAALWFLQLQLVTVAGAGANAPFALGQQFYNVIIFLPTVFGPVLLRRLSREDDEPTREHEALTVTLLVSIPCVLGLVGFNLSEPLILMLLPVRYAHAVATIRWAVIAGVLMFAKFPLSVFFQARLSALPEALANFLAAALLIGGSLFPYWSGTATRSMELRSLGHMVQFASIAVSFFLVWLNTRRKMLMNEVQ